MTHIRWSALMMPLTSLVCLWLTAVPVDAADTMLAPMPAAEVRARLSRFVEEQSLGDAERAAMLQVWGEPGAADPAQLLERAVSALGAVDAELATFAADSQTATAFTFESLKEQAGRHAADRFVTSNLHAWLGRCLAEQRLYDEALQVLLVVDPEYAIDPAAVLFFKAVAAQEILEIPEALTALDQLLRLTEQVPVRYLTIAELMQTELSGLQSQSLGEIARLMTDSERRLDLGRAGEQVQGVQERIVASLDELIKKIEEQQGGGGGGGGSGDSNSNQSSSAADDSKVKGNTAPGETDSKKFGKEGNWGDLPEKQQAAAKNLINREFPSHYRQAIEMYFKKLATRPAPPEK